MPADPPSKVFPKLKENYFLAPNPLPPSISDLEENSCFPRADNTDQQKQPCTCQARQACVAGGQWIYTNPGPLNPTCPSCLSPPVRGGRPGDIYLQHTVSKSEFPEDEQGLGVGGMNGPHGAEVGGREVLRAQPFPEGGKSVEHLL